MSREVRVRFAPSPTGPLHIGGVRTALYNYLFARRHGGKMILRIEDTDSQRFVPGAEEYIIESLKWCGIEIDEGVGFGGPHAPYRQSERREIYLQYAKQLVDAGWAYYAFDTPEQLDKLRADAEASGKTFAYNYEVREQLETSLRLSKEEVEERIARGDQWVVRFKMPENEVVKMDDLIRGHVEINTSTLDDKVLWKRADELPTDHLANIVDDHLMEITEVIRGEEWLPSLPLHYLLYEAFGWTETQPRFAHLSLLLKPDGKGKLSKRDGDRLGFPVFPLQWTNSEGEVSRGYREDGYFPEAFVNLLAMLGWNPGNDQELFSLEELVAAFSIERVIKSGARFNADKAKWFNKEYLRMKDVASLVDAYIPVLESKGLKIVDCPACALTAGSEMIVSGADFENKIFSRQYVERIVALIQERATFVADFWDIAPYLFVAPASFVEKDAAKFWKEENYTLALQVADFILGFEGEFTKEALEGPLEEYIRGNEWPMGKVMNCLRLAMVGGSNGLGIADIVTLIGKKEFAKRIDFIKATLGC